MHSSWTSGWLNDKGLETLDVEVFLSWGCPSIRPINIQSLSLRGDQEADVVAKLKAVRRR